MKTLVTGGAGFIGSHLATRLANDGHEVTVLDNFLRGNKLPKEVIRKINLVEGDVRDEKAVSELAKGCDTIFHFAAILGVDVVADNPVETMETEGAGMQNVAKAAVKHAVSKTIYASTSGVYGKAAIERALDEEFFVSPSSSYSIAKRFNEIFLKSLFQEKNLDSVSLRFFNVYGPGQDTRMVIPRFFEQAVAGQAITVFGSGKQTRDFTYIDDVIEAVIRAADKIGGAEIVNISNNREHTIGELAEMIVKVAGSKSEIKMIDAPEGRYDFEVERRFGSSDKLHRLTGFAPATDLEEGLRKTLEWLKSL
ncbi:MAG: NAD-dependent epimerase/dehydratase family protein [Planctomycetes bacterium]|nr:NAD-dependent epimerase/dehydratase family protein [Planctomycetota bacterium]